MSIRPLHAPGKLAWTLLLIYSLRVEFRAINQDRIENSKQQADFFSAQKEGFSSIAKQANENFGITASGLKESIQHLNQVSEESQSIARDTKTALLNVTGGNAFAFIYPSFVKDTFPNCSRCPERLSRDFNLKIHNAGKYQLTGVTASIGLFDEPTKDSEVRLRDFTIGTLAPDLGRMIPDSILTLQSNHEGKYLYRIAIGAQNGPVGEKMEFRPSKSGQAMAYHFVVSRGSGHRDPKIVATIREKTVTLLDSGWIEPEDSQKALRSGSFKISRK